MNIRAFLGRRLVFAVLVVLLLLVAVAFVREFIWDAQIRKDIAAFEEERSALMAENLAIKEYQSYLETQAFFEKEAREKFGQKRPGETVVFVEESGSGMAGINAESVQEAERVPSNMEQWFWYFFQPEQFLSYGR